MRVDKNFGCFKVKIEKLRLNRKHDYVLAEVLLAFRYYMGYSHSGGVGSLGVFR